MGQQIDEIRWPEELAERVESWAAWQECTVEEAVIRLLEAALSLYTFEVEGNDNS